MSSGARAAQTDSHGARVWAQRAAPDTKRLAECAMPGICWFRFGVVAAAARAAASAASYHRRAKLGDVAARAFSRHSCASLMRSSYQPIVRLLSRSFHELAAAVPRWRPDLCGRSVADERRLI